MSESLESLALEAAGNVDDGKAVDGLSELLRALAGACRERDVLKRSGCACTPDFYLASYAGGASPGGSYSWARMGLQSTTDAATSWVEYVPRAELDARDAPQPGC